MNKMHPRAVAAASRSTPKNRPGEGQNVDVVIHSFASVNGQTVQTMSVDLSNAPVPDRKYLAETCAVSYQRSSVKFLFGQQRIGKTELRSLLVIHVSPKSAARFVASLSEMDPTLEDIAARIGVAPGNGAPITEEPPQTVALAAGMVLFAVSDEEACMDFFQASPFSMGAAPHSKQLSLDPVVRVDLPTSLMLSFVSELNKIAPQLPEIKPPEQEHDRV